MISRTAPGRGNQKQKPIVSHCQLHYRNPLIFLTLIQCNFAPKVCLDKACCRAMNLNSWEDAVLLLICVK